MASEVSVPTPLTSGCQAAVAINLGMAGSWNLQLIVNPDVPTWIFQVSDVMHLVRFFFDPLTAIFV